jgi:protein subunit release factor B
LQPNVRKDIEQRFHQGAMVLCQQTRTTLIAKKLLKDSTKEKVEKSRKKKRKNEKVKRKRKGKKESSAFTKEPASRLEPP